MITLGLIFIVLVILVFFYGYNRKGTNTPTVKKKVATTIFPLYDITQNIAGDKIDVVLILPPGASPHSYEPSPDRIKNLQGSDALFYIGHGIDDWAQKLAASVDIRETIVVDRNIELLVFSSGGEEESPHYWLNAQNGIRIAEQIRDDLSLRYPEHTAVFAENYTRYASELALLDDELKQNQKERSPVKIATFHNAWDYFAKAYGVQIVAIFEEFPGETPSPEYLKEFQEKIRAHGVTVIFSEPQFAKTALEPIAGDVGATISVLDPIGGVPGRNSFVELLRYNELQIRKVAENKE